LCSSSTRVCLTEAIEHVRQKFFADADAAITHDDLDMKEQPFSAFLAYLCDFCVKYAWNSK
jgi:hypothetical protein